MLGMVFRAIHGGDIYIMIVYFQGDQIAKIHTYLPVVFRKLNISVIGRNPFGDNLQTVIHYAVNPFRFGRLQKIIEGMAGKGIRHMLVAAGEED